MPVYYNEIDSFAAQWLRELIREGHIAHGDVDTRDIRDVQPDDLRPYTQCHFFAGISVWSYALRRAGWRDDSPVWTGSCPCQPFSAAGGRSGFVDERHLWPAFFHLIEICQPGVVFGEQVASKDGLAWLDLVQADLEGTDYTSGPLDLCAAGFGAPHIRQRLFFVAYAIHAGRPERGTGAGIGQIAGSGGASLLGDTRPQGRWLDRNGTDKCAARASSLVSELADTAEPRPFPGAHPGIHRGEESARSRDAEPKRHGATNGFWHDAEWIECTDGKARPVEPGTFPLAHGAPARVGRLRGYGNAINAEAAAEFIKAAMDCGIGGLNQ